MTSRTSHPPVIGVTGNDSRLPLAWWFIRHALKRLGATPLRMTPSRPLPDRPLNGVIISGGDDIDPALYTPGLPADTAPMDISRDRFEIRMLNRFIEGDLPILGICRGAQLLNVVLGGNLHTDLRQIRQKTSNRRTPFARKTLLVESGSELAGILGHEKARINSLHHQGMNRLGEGLKVSGRDLDGIVQAIEYPGRRFMLGTQWHPEYLPTHRGQQAIFRSLCEAASKTPPHRNISL